MKEIIKKEIKRITNILQLLTNTPEDKLRRIFLLNTLKDLQKQYQIYL